MHSEPTIYNALPKVPGYDFTHQLNQPATYARTQAFAWDHGVRTVKEVVPHHGVMGTIGATIASGHTVFGVNGGVSTIGNRTIAPTERSIGVSKDAILAKHPQWRSLMDKALRYFGYFTERVEESMVEKMRVRKVCLTYHLHDATIDVVETPAVVNSGLRHATLMNRHYDPNIDINSLIVGNSIYIRARHIQIVDCDAATRAFCQSMDIHQPDPLEYPPDTFEALQLAPKKTYDVEQMNQKRANEALAAAANGKVATFMTPEEREKAKNFFEHDREVVNFFGVWDNRHFRVSMFIADGTMAVTNLHAVNNGRDPNAAFIKRSHIPKGKNCLKAIDTVSAPPQEFYREQDLTTGITINILGRDFYIYGADGWTKQYYANKYGVVLEDYEKPETEGAVIGRRPWLKKDKDPKPDYAKFVRHADDVLRFGAEILNPAPEDEGRQFIVCYYLADDTVTVMEFTVRNSGHTGGKIFSRSKVAGLKEEDLRVGKTVKLGGFTYYLKEMDERTERFLSTGKSMSETNETPEDLLVKVRHGINVKYSRITEAYRHFNITKNGIGLKELANIFTECELKVPSKEMLMKIMDLVDQDRDGVISLQEFVENVLKQSLCQSKGPVPQNEHGVRSYAQLRDEQARREEGDRVLKLFISKLEARRAFIVDTFRIVSDRAVDGMIGVDAFKEAVQGRLALNLKPSELDALVYRFFYIPGLQNWEERRLTLREFRKIVEA